MIKGKFIWLSWHVCNLLNAHNDEFGERGIGSRTQDRGRCLKCIEGILKHLKQYRGTFLKRLEGRKGIKYLI